MSAEEVRQAVEKLRPEASAAEEGKLRLLPYPGGRHPRIGFLDGAIDPQRDTSPCGFSLGKMLAMWSSICRKRFG